MPRTNALGLIVGFMAALAGCGDGTSADPGSGSEPNAGGSAGSGMGGSVSGGNAGSVNAGSGGSSGASGSGGSAGDPSTGVPPEPGDYGTRAELLEANSEMAVAQLDGKIYVLGGYPASRTTQTTVQAYDPVTDRWTLSTPLPLALHHPVVVGVNGRLYSLGGQTDGGDTNRTLTSLPPDGAWDDLMPMPTARGAGAAAVIDDKIYVVGGRPPAANAFEVYDISDDRWMELMPLPQTFNQRNHLAAAAIGGKVYVAGGRYDGGSFTDPMTDSLDVYDPALGNWATLRAMRRPRGGVNGIAAFGCFFVWGGEGSGIGEPNDVFPDHDVYNPLDDTWAPLTPLPTPVHGVTGAAFIDGLIYMPGGGTTSGGTSGSRLFQVYRPNLRCE